MELDEKKFGFYWWQYDAFIFFFIIDAKFASLSVARSPKPPSAVTYGNSQLRICRLVLILGT